MLTDTLHCNRHVDTSARNRMRMKAVQKVYISISKEDACVTD